MDRILVDIQKRMYTVNPIGSLSCLRTIADEISNGSNQIQVNDLVGYAYLACFDLAEENGCTAAEHFIRAGNTGMLKYLYRVAGVYDQSETIRLIETHIGKNDQSFITPPSMPFIGRDPEDVDRKFRCFAEANDLVILRVLQRGVETLKRCSWVYLIWDRDGIVKIYKEVLLYRRGMLGSYFYNEDDLYRTLPDNNFFPHFYGTVDVGGFTFLRQSVHFGQSLAEYTGKTPTVSSDDARFIIRGIAEALDILHGSDIVHLDLKPENILMDTIGVRLLDLGVSKTAKGNERIFSYLTDPRFGTPECGKYHEASKASDIFQLGVLSHLLLTGVHPFEHMPFIVKDSYEYRESAILRYFWPTLVSLGGYGHQLGGISHMPIVQAMLEEDPDKRPTASDIVKALTGGKQIAFTQKSRKTPRERTHNTVLFPARMGIPHKGHIEYIRRVLELGYHVLISLSRAHTITQRDPIPKSFVMKMVAQSLIDYGFRPEIDFSFIFTPLYLTKAELEYHFLSMPHIDDVIAVASGNPGTGNLFHDWPLFDQQSVFGREGETWMDLSWGETVRASIRDNDYVTFGVYAATGVEKIVSFIELRTMYAKPFIEFASFVEAVVMDGDKEVCRGRIFRYMSPEQSIVWQLTQKGWKVKSINPYDRDTVIDIDGKPMRLAYLRTEFVPETGHESIYYTLSLHKEH